LLLNELNPLQEAPHSFFAYKAVAQKTGSIEKDELEDFVPQFYMCLVFGSNYGKYELFE
jgi:hypothetical protein